MLFEIATVTTSKREMHEEHVPLPLNFTEGQICALVKVQIWVQKKEAILGSLENESHLRKSWHGDKALMMSGLLED